MGSDPHSHVILLRGVDVGGAKKVPKSSLATPRRRLLEP